MTNEKQLPNKEQLTAEGVEKIFVTRAPGEPDMVAEVEKILREEGISEEKIAIYLADPNISFASNKNSNVQRFKLNTWLDVQYLSTNRQVSMERSMIMDHGAPSMWLETFRKFHVPFMKKLNLPSGYDHFVGVMTDGEKPQGS